MKRSSLYFALSLLLVLGGISACKTQYDTVLESNDVDLKYKAAFDYFNAGKSSSR